MTGRGAHGVGYVSSITARTTRTGAKHAALFGRLALSQRGRVMAKLAGLHTNIKWSDSLMALKDELAKWGVKDYLLPTWDKSYKAHSVSLDIAVNGQWMPISCGRFPTPEQNIRAILQIIESTRKASQRGIGLTLFQAAAITQKMLPSGEKDPCEVLGVPLGTTDRQTLRSAYTTRVKETHPDLGGDPQAFIAVQAAGEKLGIAG